MCRMIANEIDDRCPAMGVVVVLFEGFQLTCKYVGIKLRLNMEIDLQSLFGLHVHSCTHWLRPRTPPPFPPHLGQYTRALLVSREIDDISL